MPRELFPACPVLLVDDDPLVLQSYDCTLRNDGINNTVRCRDSRGVLDLVATGGADVILLDLAMPHVSGQQLLPELVNNFPDIPVIVVTADSDVDTAVHCIKQGALDYLVKPVEVRRLCAAVRTAVKVRDVQRENSSLKRHLRTSTLEHPEAFARIIGHDPRMHALFLYVESVAPSREPVFIVGETGSGKELVARAVHDASGRAGEFVSVNVAGLDDAMFADTLFGHVPGAYTGAAEAREGLIARAAGGTLFLDEIGDLSLPSQVKLLRFLQEHEYTPIGSDDVRQSDTCVVVATNRDIRTALEEGRLRQDLYFRLLTHLVRVPPLRERMGDLAILVDRFLDEAAAGLNRKRPTPPAELTVLLSTYHFPGNVRELKAMVHNAVASHRGGVLSLTSFTEHINDAFREPGARPGAAATSDAMLFPDRLPTLQEMTSLMVMEALRRAEDNQSIAASLLGVSRQTMNRYCRELRQQ